MAIFNSYVKLPEGTHVFIQLLDSSAERWPYFVRPHRNNWAMKNIPCCTDCTGRSTDISLTHRIHVCYIYIYIYGDIYHQYTPNVSIYTIHGSYGLWVSMLKSFCSKNLIKALIHVNTVTCNILRLYNPLESPTSPRFCINNPPAMPCQAPYCERLSQNLRRSGSRASVNI